jgi:hypothetical protein
MRKGLPHPSFPPAHFPRDNLILCNFFGLGKTLKKMGKHSLLKHPLWKLFYLYVLLHFSIY